MDDVWAIFDKAGQLLYISRHANEADCWHIYLGWPGDAEIEIAQRRGLVCERVTMLRTRRSGVYTIERADDASSETAETN